MFCNHCGKENPDGSKVCGYCGREIMNMEAQPAATANPVAPAAPQSPSLAQKIKNTDKQKLKKYGIIGGAALLAVIVMIVIIVSATTKVSLKKYVADELTFTGINGYGKADISDFIDFEALNRDIKKKEKTPSKFDEFFGYYDSYYTSASEYIEYECTSENNGKLSNGDKVVITVTVDKDGMKSDPGFSKRLSGGKTIEFKYKVEGLPDGTIIDIFDAVDSVSIDTTNSYSPSVKINLKDNYKKDYGVGGINVQTSDSSIRVYGDEFQSFGVSVHTVTDNIDENTKSIKLVTDSNMETIVEYGIALASTEKAFTPRVISYVKDASFSKDDLAKLNTKMSEFTAQKFGSNSYKLTGISVFYREDSPDAFLAYIYKVKEGIAVTYFDHIKQDQNGRIYELDDLDARIDGFWGYNTYKNLDEFKKANSNYTKVTNVPLS